MRQTMLIAAVLLAMGVGAAEAGTAGAVDAGPVIQNSQAMAAADQLPPINMREQIQEQMTKAGFTDVTVMPTAFYVHAKNKQGEPVAMVIGPDGFTAVTEVPMTGAAPKK